MEKFNFFNVIKVSEAPSVFNINLTSLKLKVSTTDISGLVDWVGCGVEHWLWFMYGVLVMENLKVPSSIGLFCENS